MLHFLPQGGSFGRGTDLRGGCDVELVIFYKVLRDFKGQRSQQAEILCDIRTQLQSWWQEPVHGLSLQFAEQNRPSALQLRLVSTDLNSWADISVVPAFDAVGKRAVGPQGTRDHGTGVPTVLLGIHQALKISLGNLEANLPPEPVSHAAV